MIKIFIIFLVVIGASISDPLRLPATRIHKFGRQTLSHTKTVLQYYKNLQQHSLRRHDLSNIQTLQNYEQLPLQTNHVGFTLDLTIAGLSYKLSMDTGSSDFFIKGQNSPGAPIKKYKSNQKYTQMKVISIGYLDGYLKTYATVLNVQFNGHSFNAPLLVAYTAPKQFQDVQGLIGLSYPQLAKHQPTFIQTLITQNIISKYAFGMNLNLLQQNRSFVSFGQPDSQLYQGQLNQYNISKSGDISISFGSITVGSSPQMKINSALLDTGNTCISIPRIYQQTILQYFNTLNNKCVFVVEDNVPMFSMLLCKIHNFTELPAITMTIGSEQYVIQKQYYLQACTQNPQQLPPAAYYCQTYIESVSYPPGNVIFLGDAFFSRFYTYFDLQDQKIGLAKNRQNITLDDVLAIQDLDYYFSDWIDLDM